MPRVHHKKFLCVGFTLKLFKDNCWLQLLKLNREGIPMKKVRKRQCTGLFTKMSNAILLRIVPLPTMYRLFLTVWQQCTDFSWQYWLTSETNQWKEILPCAIFLSSVRGRSTPLRTNNCQWLPGSNRCRSLPQRSVLGSPRYPARNTEKNRKLVQISRWKSFTCWLLCSIQTTFLQMEPPLI